MEEKVRGATINKQGFEGFTRWEKVAFNRGVILAKEYEHMSGQYFSTFVRTNLSKLFEDAKEQKWFVTDNDPSQRSKAAKKAINESGATLFAIPPRSPDLNPIDRKPIPYREKKAR